MCKCNFLTHWSAGRRLLRRGRAACQVPLSHLQITGDYRIFLTDYNNVEIKLSSLPKTVFFFFLRHPEGLMFKDLSDYRKELLMIYRKISNREDPDGMEDSIDDLVDSTKNSINEKCSRIREAFVKAFDEEVAENYIVTGKARTPKGITLPRTLIVDDAGIL